MQSTSASYAPYCDARWSNFRASFKLIDQDAAADATATATGSESISQLAQTHNGVETMGAKWATLERGGWPLDGSMAIMPDSVASVQTGLWSELSGADCTFATEPTLTFTFAGNHSSAGFTVFFDDKANRYPGSMTVAAYDASDVLIDSETVTVTSVKQTVNLSAANYRKIIITFNSTQRPFERVRVCEVAFGITQTFDKSNLTNASLLYELSPTGENLPTHELVLTFDNSDHAYNMLSPNSLYAYLEQSQPIEVEIGVGDDADGIEYVGMGTFYFAKSEAADDSLTAKITAYDRFYQLDKGICDIGADATWTVSDAVAAVIADSGLTITTSIPTATGALTIYKRIPKDASHREALRLIAQAAMTTCYFDRDGTLVFAEVVPGPSVDTLDSGNMSASAKVSITDRINTVRLTVKDEYSGFQNVYSANNIASGETAQVWSVENPLVYDGNTVVAWLLAMAQHRTVYALSERGNPAREIADTATIYDAYSVNADAVITKEQYSYDGSLSCETIARK